MNTVAQQKLDDVRSALWLAYYERYRQAVANNENSKISRETWDNAYPTASDSWLLDTTACNAAAAACCAVLTL